MTNLITGTVTDIIVSGDTISGDDEVAMEATVNTGRERDTFQPIGSDTYTIIAGLKTCGGTVRAAWASGGTCFQDLLDNDSEFEVVIQLTGGVSITASGCRVDNIARRAAPNTEVLTEEMTFTGRSWY